MIETELFVKLLPWIKDLGLPVIALYYLFRAYTARIDKTDKILDQYAGVIQEHALQYEKLSHQIHEVAEAIKADIVTRDRYFERLITAVSASRSLL